MAVVLEIGIPLAGMIRTTPGHRLAPGHATDLLNVRRVEGELTTRPGLTPFADTPDTKPIQNLFTAELATGTKTLLRFDEDKVYAYNGTIWDELMSGATVFTGSATQPFGIAMCNNEVVFSQGVAADKAWRWTGSGDIAQIANSGVFTDRTFKYVAFYAGRVIGAYTNDTTGGAIQLLGSERGSNTSWVAAQGAIDTYLNDTPSYIQGLSANDNELIVWKERAVIRGIETGDPTLPIAFRNIQADGIGSIGQRCAAAFGGAWFNLSPEGFYVLNSGVPQFIDSGIRHDFWRRVNPDAFAQIHSVTLDELAQVVWFVPEGTDTHPHNAWVYDIATQGWDRWDFGGLAITAAARTFVSDGGFQVVDDYSANPGDLVDTGSISGVVVDSLGSSAATSNYILGDQRGRTFTLASYIDTDNNTTFQWRWETGDFRWEGQTDSMAGAVVGPHDLVTFTELMLEYRHANLSGKVARIQIQVSADGGNSWTALTTNGRKTHPLADTTDDYTRLRAFGRISGYRIRLRFTLNNVSGFPKFRDLRVFGQLAGEIR
jgi:hypothetical protein